MFNDEISSIFNNLDNIVFTMDNIILLLSDCETCR